jgi:hypothetical protein
MQNKISKTTKKILIAVAVLDFCLLSVLGVAMYLTKKMATDIDTQRQMSLDNREKSKKNLRLAELVRGIGPMSKQTEQYFVSFDNIVEFSEYLETLATKADVDLSKSITRSADGLSVSLTFKGSFDNTLYFVGLIESLPYVVNVESVSLSGPSKLEVATSTKDFENRKIGGMWSGSMSVNLKGSGQK